MLTHKLHIQRFDNKPSDCGAVILLLSCNKIFLAHPTGLEAARYDEIGVLQPRSFDPKKLDTLANEFVREFFGGVGKASPAQVFTYSSNLAIFGQVVDRTANNAHDELRNEFHDVALRIKQTPDQFRVLIELRLRAQRDPVIAAILAKQDRGFQGHLTSIVLRGIE